MTKYIDGLNRIVWGGARVGADRWRGSLPEPAASLRPADAVPQSMEALSFHASPGAEKRERGDALSGAVYGAGGDRRDGNIVGVAGAICLGGRGPFWWWICGVLGMVTKYAEVHAWRFATG